MASEVFVPLVNGPLRMMVVVTQIVDAGICIAMPALAVAFLVRFGRRLDTVCFAVSAMAYAYTGSILMLMRWGRSVGAMGDSVSLYVAKYSAMNFCVAAGGHLLLACAALYFLWSTRDRSAP